MVDDEPSDAKDESGWKLLAGDVFRAPADTKALCVYVGSGAQVGGLHVPNLAVKSALWSFCAQACGY